MVVHNAAAKPLMAPAPGLIAAFGSGETSLSGLRVYKYLLKRLAPPLKIAILETPAGFQPNSAIVAGKVGQFLQQHLKNYKPQINIIAARRRGSEFSPDNADIVAPVHEANFIFLGPGSPTYAVRQLEDSLAWQTVLACQRQGAILVLASAATIAASSFALPVYEIYKAGADLYWSRGLDLFAAYGLKLVFISHWNNHEGGADLDTSHAYIGAARFAALRAMLPADVTVVGIDEHTALIFDTGAETCHVLGKGSVTIIRDKVESMYASGSSFAINVLGNFRQVEPQSGIAQAVWEDVLLAKEKARARQQVAAPAEVVDLVQARESARSSGKWRKADRLRIRILNAGWQVNDLPEGPQVLPREAK